MQKLSQRDPRWSSVRLGASPLTLGGYGCTTTCVAMIEGITPDKIATHTEVYTNPGGLILWSKLNAILKNVQFEWRDVVASAGFNKAKVDSRIEKGEVLFEVDGGAHWVLPIRKSEDGKDYVANDPWTGKECNVRKVYHNITKVVFFKRIRPLESVLPEEMAHLKGRFLIAVEDGGRLYFVDTKGKKHNLGGTPEEIQKTIAKMAVGIKNADLKRIPE